MCCSESTEQVLRSKHPGEGTGVTDLPTGLTWKSRYLHAVRSTPGARGGAFAGRKLSSASATGELNCQALAHEVGSMEGCGNISNY